MLAELMRQWRSEGGSRARRVVALGSSNTELGPHCDGRFNWVSWLEVQLRQTVGMWVSVTNVGIGGETVTDLLARFDRDVTPHRPEVVVITVGGNDQWHLPLTTYRQRLAELVERVKGLDAVPVVQTYYSQMLEPYPTVNEGFVPWNEAMREVARAAGVPCIEGYWPMLAWHRREPATYAGLMRDGAHLNAAGHAVFGTLCTRAFGLPDAELPGDIAGQVRGALAGMRAGS